MSTRFHFPLLRMIKNRILPKGRRILKIPFGLYQGIRMEMDLSSQTQLYLGLWERETHAWLRKFSEGINMAMDVGAACGEQTLYFMKKTSAKKVYAFESSADLCDSIKKNIALNGGACKKTKIISQKVGFKKEDGGCVELDDYSDLMTAPCVVKIDIEGNEIQALKGAEKLLAASRVRWLVETHSAELEQQCVELFESHHYTTRVISNAWWRCFIPETRYNKHNRWLAAFRDHDIKF